MFSVTSEDRSPALGIFVFVLLKDGKPLAEREASTETKDGEITVFLMAWMFRYGIPRDVKKQLLGDLRQIRAIRQAERRPVEVV